MKYLRYNRKKVNERILDEELKYRCGKNAKSFSRNRKSSANDIILYNLNNRGYSTKMELYDFNKLTNRLDISAPGLLKQRMNLREEIFKELNKESLVDFYKLFPKEVKTYKDYVLLGIDGSDCEVPNTKETRERYKAVKSQNDSKVARIKLSNCYDLLNKYVIDTEVERYKYSERSLALQHAEYSKFIKADFNTMFIMDRGYCSLGFLYELDKKNDKFLCRLDKKSFKDERSNMINDDEIVEILYESNRVNGFKKASEELYNLYKNGKTISFRIVNIELSTGEIETLITNLNADDFSSNDLYKLYGMRWGSETNYHELKQSMKVEAISSSFDCIIKQEIYATMMVYNLITSITNDLEDEIDQTKYKNKQKINFNMAVGFAKRFLIQIFLEDDDDKKSELSNELFNNMLDNIVPIRPGRSHKRETKPFNKHSINKRKTY